MKQISKRRLVENPEGAGEKLFKYIYMFNQKLSFIWLVTGTRDSKKFPRLGQFISSHV